MALKALYNTLWGSNGLRCPQPTPLPLVAISFEHFASGLLSLPTELQLAIFEQLPGWGEDAFDAAILSIGKGLHMCSAKSFSFMLSSPALFDRFYAHVVETHPIICYDVVDLMRFVNQRQGLVGSIKRIILSFDPCTSDAVCTALTIIAALPNVQKLEVRFPEDTDLSKTNIILSQNPDEYPALEEMILSKPTTKRRYEELDEHYTRAQAEARRAGDHRGAIYLGLARFTDPFDTLVEELRELRMLNAGLAQQIEIRKATQATVIRTRCDTQDKVLSTARIGQRAYEYSNGQWQLVRWPTVETDKS